MQTVQPWKLLCQRTALSATNSAAEPPDILIITAEIIVSAEVCPTDKLLMLYCRSERETLIYMQAASLQNCCNLEVGNGITNSDELLSDAPRILLYHARLNTYIKKVYESELYSILTSKNWQGLLMYCIFHLKV